MSSPQRAGSFVPRRPCLGPTHFLYDGALPIIELDAGVNLAAVNTFGANGLHSRRSATTGASVYYTFGEQGNVAQRFDSSFNVLSTGVHDAFGVGQRTPSGAGSNEPWSYGAQWGCYTDPETALVFMTHRYYEPLTPVARPPTILSCPRQRCGV